MLIIPVTFRISPSRPVSPETPAPRAALPGENELDNELAVVCCARIIAGEVPRMLATSYCMLVNKMLDDVPELVTNPPSKPMNGARIGKKLPATDAIPYARYVVKPADVMVSAIMVIGIVVAVDPIDCLIVLPHAVPSAPSGSRPFDL